MTKRTLVFFCWAFLLAATATGATDYKTEYFVIRSDLDPCYVQIVQANAEACYKNLCGRYFQIGWQEPLMIYYSRTEAETRQLLDMHGQVYEEPSHGYYADSVPAIYIHQLTNEGKIISCNYLFKQIVRHFIHLNYPSSPTWFKEGLTCFLGEQSRIVKAKLIPKGTTPLNQQILRDKIETGVRANIRSLFSKVTEEQFRNWDIGRQFTRAFFYWLYETGQLELYLKNAPAGSFGLPVLEWTLSKKYGKKDPIGKANMEFSKNFVKKNCYAEAYLQDGQSTNDRSRKEQALLKALEIKPDYYTARLELAKCYYRTKDYEKCRQNLNKILNAPENIEYLRAARLMGNTYYNEKDYSNALEYYNKAWEYSDYYEYKYEIAYRIANCHYYLEDENNAGCWFGKFLNCNWQPECTDQMKRQVNYARDYFKKAAKLEEGKKTKGKARKKS